MKVSNWGGKRRLLAFFLLAFLTELLITTYTVAVARGNILVATTASGLVSVLKLTVWVQAVHNRAIIYVGALGEMLGTFVVLTVVSQWT